MQKSAVSSNLLGIAIQTTSKCGFKVIDLKNLLIAAQQFYIYLIDYRGCFLFTSKKNGVQSKVSVHI